MHIIQVIFFSLKLVSQVVELTLSVVYNSHNN